MATLLEARALARYLGSAAQRDKALGQLQEALVDRLGAISVIGTDSGTSALRLALESAVGRGGLVALPAYGCFDLITAARGAGCRVVLYDIDPETLAPDMASLEAALARGAEAVVVASIFGYAPPMPAIASLVARFDAVLIEDIAQGAEARWDGTLLGSWGELVVLSFGRGKGLGGGGGGALVVRSRRKVNVELSPRRERRRVVTGIGTLLAQALLTHPLVFALPSAIPVLRLGETIYHEPWIPFALHPFQAALAGAALRDSARIRDQRASRATTLMRALTNDGGMRVIDVDPRSEPGFLRLGVRADDRMVERLRALGARRSYPVPLHEHPAMQPLLHESSDTEGARILARELASLPSHHRFSDADLAELIQIAQA